ncbi:MAG: hypothetical protein ACI8PT_002556 [Gammaproteobacteria bacterium]|jgi:hypothetical protein
MWFEPYVMAMVLRAPPRVVRHHPLLVLKPSRRHHERTALTHELSLNLARLFPVSNDVFAL